MKNKIQTVASIFSLLVTPWLWFCSRVSPKLLKATLLTARALLHPRFASMLIDEPLSKIGVPKGVLTQPKTLFLSESIPILTSLELSDYIQRSFFLRGFPDFTFELLRFCDRSTYFFDIGANVGFISCAVSHWVPSEQIHSFEPIPANFERLQENLTRNCPTVRAHQFALSDQAGSFEMVTCSHDSGSASLETKYRTERLEELGYPTEMQTIQVQTLPFDSFVTEQRLDFSTIKKAAFKIDVEGHEKPVLQGMDTFLRENRTALEMLFVVEVHRQNFDDIKAFFATREFQCIWPDEREIAAFFERSGAAIDLIFHRIPTP